MDPNRKQWNEQHKALGQALTQNAKPEAASELFLALHASLHARSVSGADGWNLEEGVWNGLTDEAFRRIPAGEDHSIAWCYWHLARIEDITMNLLVARTDQLFAQSDWQQRLHSPIQDTGNLITPEGMALLSQQVEMAELRAYRSAVGQRTREIVQQLRAEDFKRKSDPADLQRMLDEGAATDYAHGLIDYWRGLTVAGLLLMPPTRHNLIHLNESITLKRKAQKTLTAKH